MSVIDFPAAVLSRRDFLAASAVAMSAATLSFGGAAAQTPAKYRRLNVTDPGAAPMLESYKVAIRKMLDLPPEDPRNWYRNALVHTLDCPHGNWWFVVWHRGYVGWFEQTCRELSGDPNFALPYWDWTQDPRVPDVMFDDVLTPNDSAFIKSLAEFKDQFEDVVNAYWNSFSPDQIDQLLVRGLRFPADLWFDIAYPPGPMFFDQPRARGLTRENPGFDAGTARAVSAQTLAAALAPRDFLTFGSPRTFFHSGLTGFGVLEGQPHNTVHNNVGGITTVIEGGQPVTTNVGGFMQSNLSPVDPIFFLHHSNIDRLWDLWTRKQQAFGLPILPDGYLVDPPVQGTDYFRWSNEPFLFFIDAQGQPVTKNTAGGYATIGDFDYDYQPGSGENVIPAVVAAAPAAAAEVQSFSAELEAADSATTTTGGTAAVPPQLLQAEGPGAPTLLAKVTVALPPLAHPGNLAVVLNAPADTTEADSSSPHFAGTLSMFGHQIVSGPVTWTLPLAEPVATLRANSLLGSDGMLNLRVVPTSAGANAVGASGTTMDDHEAERVEVLSIVVEAH
jgi:tyrosinase